MRALRDAAGVVATGAGAHFLRTDRGFLRFLRAGAKSRCVWRHVDRDTADMIISGVADELNSVVLPGGARGSSAAITAAKVNGSEGISRSRSSLDLIMENDLCRMELVTLD